MSDLSWLWTELTDIPNSSSSVVERYPQGWKSLVQIQPGVAKVQFGSIQPKVQFFFIPGTGKTNHVTFISGGSSNSKGPLAPRPIQCNLVSFTCNPAKSRGEILEVTVPQSDHPTANEERSSAAHNRSTDRSIAEIRLPPGCFRPELSAGLGSSLGRNSFRESCEDEEDHELAKRGNFTKFTTSHSETTQSFHGKFYLALFSGFCVDACFSAESLSITHALFACLYGANLLVRADKRLFDLDIIPRIIGLESSRNKETAKYDYTLVQMETALLNLASGYQQSVGLFYFLAYESGHGRVFVRWGCPVKYLISVIFHPSSQWCLPASKVFSWF